MPVKEIFLAILRSAMEGHNEQENTLNQLLVEMDGKVSFVTKRLVLKGWNMGEE